MTLLDVLCALLSSPSTPTTCSPLEKKYLKKHNPDSRMTSHCRNIKEHQNTYPLHSLLTFSRLTAFFFLPYLYCCIPLGLVKLKHHSRCMTGNGSHVQRRRVCLRGNDEFLLLLPNTKCEANSPWTSDTSLHSGAERILAAGMNPSILAQMSPLLPTSLQTWRLANPTKKNTTCDCFRD